MTLRHALSTLTPAAFCGDGVFFRKICSEDDLDAAVCGLYLPPEQQELVNPAGFSIGRAYLFPEDNVPYLICKRDATQTPVGFILLRFCHATDDPRTWARFRKQPPRTNWSYFITAREQGKGYGTAAARLAISLLIQAMPGVPIELTTEQENERAQRLYLALGFTRTDEMDGDDPVFLLDPAKKKR